MNVHEYREHMLSSRPPDFTQGPAPSGDDATDRLNLSTALVHVERALHSWTHEIIGIAHCCEERAGEGRVGYQDKATRIQGKEEEASKRNAKGNEPKRN